MMTPVADRMPVNYMERTRHYYAAQGFAAAYTWARHDGSPFTPLARPVRDCTLALITTAAMHRRTADEPRQVVSDSTATPPAQLYGDDLSWDREATHLDDLDSFFPIHHLQAIVAERGIGHLAARFHCIPTEYSQRRTTETDAPEVLRRCRADGADIALFFPL